MHPAKQKILEYLVAHPTESYVSVARKVNVSPATISRIAREGGLPTKKNIHPDLSQLSGLTEEV